MEYKGALSDQMISEMVSAGFLSGVSDKNIGPGSLDLTLDGTVYRVNGAFLPSCDESVLCAVKRAGGVELSGEKIILERGGCYALPLVEKVVSLPNGVYGYCNPKSSSGRVDVHVRVMTNNLSRYDAISKGYSGEVWLLVAPKTFPVVVSPGLTLNQVRFFNQDTRLDELRLEMSFAQNGGLLFDGNGRMFDFRELKHSDRDGSILLTLGLDFPTPGFEAIETGEPIDLSLKAHYDPRYFFKEVPVIVKSLTLSAGKFYILSTCECVRVPPSLACEMTPMDERSGDLRSHYAGFIDPGWGVGEHGSSKGRTLTLEVRSFDNGIIIRNRQPIAKIKYERMIGCPNIHYDQKSPTYGDQSGPKLGKYFLTWK